ncbi:MAG TPA: sigma-70 family RNA polymerase sigma factor [Candidatus Binatia bacterium]|nr:sigma-70 family RNA polymerase sigma factor [Candidatus Binatia bacterium]
MKRHIELKDFSLQKSDQKLLDDGIARIEKKVANFSPDLVALRLLLEKNPTRSLYRASMTLELPGRTLAAKEERHEIHECLRQAFAHLERQLDAYKAALRREPLWKRNAMRERLRRSKIAATPVEQQNREVFFSAVVRNLARLYEWVRHQLASLQAAGDLAKGELTEDDVVDAVILRAYGEFVRSPAARDFATWLMQLASEHLRVETERLKSERERTVRIEEDLPETPTSEAVSTLGDEILEFYQPDEDLKLEDIFPDEEISTPEEWVAAKEELLTRVNAALAGMPREWRLTLRLRYAEKLTGAALAQALDQPEPEVERRLEYARQHLRQSLVEAGYRFAKRAPKAGKDAAGVSVVER